jgi:hypothetical protein
LSLCGSADAESKGTNEVKMAKVIANKREIRVIGKVL